MPSVCSMTDGTAANHRHCWYCGRWMPETPAHPAEPVRRTREHLLPLSRGGDNSPENIVYACLRCNRDKGVLTVGEYRVLLAVRTGTFPVFWGETAAAEEPDPLAYHHRRGGRNRRARPCK
jgi:hypothetical protein